ncbi:hypothetical protein ACFPL7_05330 [Dongia soli]|uniref:Uncharacterized protein n=1 Tax=Dongia soli TaxID=600628 RepID=A0ABU5EEQ1_9PROT|nr:hypothetical protein [Dongia soli]MDY0884821.1 hypothetical protein [Dongia soli]
MERFDLSRMSAKEVAAEMARLSRGGRLSSDNAAEKDVPAQEPTVRQKPAMDTSATETSATEMPATEMPATETPVEATGAAPIAAKEAPAAATPAAKTSAKDTSEAKAAAKPAADATAPAKPREPARDSLTRAPTAQAPASGVSMPPDRSAAETLAAEKAITPNITPPNSGSTEPPEIGGDDLGEKAAAPEERAAQPNDEFAHPFPNLAKARHADRFDTRPALPTDPPRAERIGLETTKPAVRDAKNGPEPTDPEALALKEFQRSVFERIEAQRRQQAAQQPPARQPNGLPSSGHRPDAQPGLRQAGPQLRSDQHYPPMRPAQNPAGRESQPTRGPHHPRRDDFRQPDLREPEFRQAPAYPSDRNRPSHPQGNPPVNPPVNPFRARPNATPSARPNAQPTPRANTQPNAQPSPQPSPPPNAMPHDAPMTDYISNFDTPGPELLGRGRPSRPYRQQDDDAAFRATRRGPEAKRDAQRPDDRRNPAPQQAERRNPSEPQNRPPREAEKRRRDAYDRDAYNPAAYGPAAYDPAYDPGAYDRGADPDFYDPEMQQRPQLRISPDLRELHDLSVPPDLRAGSGDDIWPGPRERWHWERPVGVLLVLAALIVGPVIYYYPDLKPRFEKLSEQGFSLNAVVAMGLDMLGGPPPEKTATSQPGSQPPGSQQQGEQAPTATAKAPTPPPAVSLDKTPPPQPATAQSQAPTPQSPASQSQASPPAPAPQSQPTQPQASPSQAPAPQQASVQPQAEPAGTSSDATEASVGTEPQKVGPARVEPKKSRSAMKYLEPPAPNAWLKAQPYDPSGGAGFTPPEQSPDAWMKPRPYNPGGVLEAPPGTPSRQTK